ncbi:MAG: class I SAM-dependent rRNA methyltransferase, partial [Bacteroidota bacterium]
LKAYRRLTKLALQINAPRGILLLASCSARVSTEEFFQLQREELASSGRSYREMETTQHDIDHPVTFPEGSYLKSIYFELL